MKLVPINLILHSNSSNTNCKQVWQSNLFTDYEYFLHILYFYIKLYLFIFIYLYFIYLFIYILFIFIYIYIFCIYFTFILQNKFIILNVLSFYFFNALSSTICVLLLVFSLLKSLFYIWQIYYSIFLFLMLPFLLPFISSIVRILSVKISLPYMTLLDKCVILKLPFSNWFFLIKIILAENFLQMLRYP